MEVALVVGADKGGEGNEVIWDFGWEGEGDFGGAVSFNGDDFAFEAFWFFSGFEGDVEFLGFEVDGKSVGDDQSDVISRSGCFWWGEGNEFGVFVFLWGFVFGWSLFPRVLVFLFVGAAFVGLGLFDGGVGGAGFWVGAVAEGFEGVVFGITHEFFHAFLEGGEGFGVVGGVDEVDEAVGVGGDVVEFFGDAVVEKVEAFGDVWIGFGDLAHGAVGGGAGGGCFEFVGAVGPRVPEVEVIFSLHGSHGVAASAGVFVVDFEDGVAVALFLPEHDGDEAPSIVLLRSVIKAKEIHAGGGEIDGGDHVVFFDRAGFGEAGDADEERGVSGMMPECGFGEGQGHAVIGEENGDGVVVFAGFLEGIEDGADGVISSSDRGIVEGQFFADLGVVEEEAGDGDLVGFEGF